MIILLTGASGFIGRPLAERLSAAGHELRFLTRSPSQREPDWTRGGSISMETIRGLMDGVEAVIHLAGENIGAWPWSKTRKRLILESRIFGTRALVEAMAKMEKPPKTFISASATGFYGDAGAIPCTEASPLGQGFLAEVVGAWENEIFKAKALGIRTVAIRNGIVLGVSPSAVAGGSGKPLGVLGKMTPSFKLGLGAVLGPGTQYLSWIHLEDTLGIFLHSLANPEIQGPINACAPEPIMQNEFSLCLAKVLHRPRWFRIPAFVLRLMLGEMSATVLEGQRVDASRIINLGYRFRYPSLEPALKNLFQN